MSLKLSFLFIILLPTTSIARGHLIDTYPIIQAEHPTLREVATEVELHQVTQASFQKYLKKMFKTMKRNTGVGLAAPQINRSEKLFVIGDFFSGVKKRVFINPEVELLGTPDKLSHEGCLSAKDHGMKKIPRHSKVYVRYYDDEGLYHEREFKGITAIVIQHEYDHLMGKLIIDYDQQKFSSDLEPIQIPFAESL